MASLSDVLPLLPDPLLPDDPPDDPPEPNGD
jgi:hypothetical protein